MQSNEEEGHKAAEEGGDETEIAREGSVARTISIPTKEQDGGMDEQEKKEVSQGQEAQQYFRSSSSSSLQDSFRRMSNDDTRMLSLLGIDPDANPNDGEEEREDWRRLTGFLGQAAEANVDVDEGNEEDIITPRKTRLSYELHTNAFTHMWLQRGDLNGDRRGGGGQQQQQYE